MGKCCSGVIGLWRVLCFCAALCVPPCVPPSLVLSAVQLRLSGRSKKEKKPRNTLKMPKPRRRMRRREPWGGVVLASPKKSPKKSPMKRAKRVRVDTRDRAAEKATVGRGDTRMKRGRGREGGRGAIWKESLVR